MRPPPASRRPIGASEHVMALLRANPSETPAHPAVPLSPWNVVATAKDLEQRHLARRLRRFGDFRWTEFRGVLIGRVEDHEAFFEQLRRNEEDEPGFLSPLSKLVPIERTFSFTLETFLPLVKEAIVPYLDRIGDGSFYVRMERRGHSGEIHAQTVEQELGRHVIEALQARGATPRIDYKNPEAILVIETIGNECGVGLITRTLHERYPFVRAP